MTQSYFIFPIHPRIDQNLRSYAYRHFVFRCEIDIDECNEQSPCFNGATCVDLAGSYRCDCTELWTGIQCTLPIDVPCSYDSNYPCLHHGVCRNATDAITRKVGGNLNWVWWMKSYHFHYQCRSLQQSASCHRRSLWSCGYKIKVF